MRRLALIGYGDKGLRASRYTAGYADEFFKTFYHQHLILVKHSSKKIARPRLKMKDWGQVIYFTDTPTGIPAKLTGYKKIQLCYNIAMKSNNMIT